MKMVNTQICENGENGQKAKQFKLLKRKKFKLVKTQKCENGKNAKKIKLQNAKM